jgi:hypothetical protein
MPRFQDTVRTHKQTLQKYITKDLKRKFFLLGVLREVSKRIYKVDVTITVNGRTQRSVQMSTGERLEEHVIFLIKVITFTGWA